HEARHDAAPGGHQPPGARLSTSSVAPPGAARPCRPRGAWEPRLVVHSVGLSAAAGCPPSSPRDRSVLAYGVKPARPTCDSDLNIPPVEGKMSYLGMKQLLEAGVHFGHETKRANPKMKRFIFAERNGIFIIDLQKTLVESEKAFDFLKSVAQCGGTILFVGAKKQAQEILAA